MVLFLVLLFSALDLTTMVMHTSAVLFRRSVGSVLFPVLLSPVLIDLLARHQSSASISEISCVGGLDAVPQFLPNDRLFHALYLSRQNINELIQGSFANLQVGFL